MSLKVRSVFRRRALSRLGLGLIAIAFFVLIPPSLKAATFTVTNTADSGAGSLRQAIIDANAAGGGLHSIDFTAAAAGTITLSSALPLITSSVTIDGGSSVTVDGASAHRAFFADTGSNVTIENLTIQNTLGQGGDGADGAFSAGGGGGGLGAGGAIFVNNGAVVVVENVTYANNDAQGGNGGDSHDPNTVSPFFAGGGGGGGFGGDGGADTGETGGGGGGGGFDGTGGDASPVENGAGGGGGGGLGADGGDGAATPANGDKAGGSGGGGGGDGGKGKFDPLPLSGGEDGGDGARFGGGGGDGDGDGGDGGDFGGGGGGGDIDGSVDGLGLGGNGGFGGGGGGGGEDPATDAAATGGMGGFGSGGGGGGAGFGAIGASSGGTSDGGFGGTGGGSDSGVDTAGGGGGGGAGLGGAVFVRSGGTFTIRDSDIDATNDATGGQGGATGTGGAAGADGQGVGGALFIMSGVTATYEVTGAGSQTVAGDIGGGGAIKKISTGSLTLSAANSYAGGTTISDGRVVMQNTAALGTGGVTFDNMGVGAADPRLVFGVVGVDLAAGVTLSTNGKINSNGFDGKVSSVIGGAGDLTKTGDGTLTLEADNTFTGATQIADGTLELASGASLHRDTTLDISMGATFDLTDNTQTVSQLSGAGRLDLGTGELTVDQSTNTTFSGPVTGAGGLTKTGSGSLKLSNAGNDFSGGTTIADGTLSLANAGALGTGSVTFDAAGPGADPVLQAMSDMTLAAGVDLTTDGTFDNLGFDVDFSGMVTGVGGLTKTGSGVLTFSGTASHTGGTEVVEGTLRVTGDHRSAVRVMAGTRLEGSGMVGDTRITGGTLAPGGRFGVLTVKGNLTFDPGSRYEVEVDPGGATDRTDVRGKADLSGATVVVLAENGAYTPDTTYQILTAGDPITTQFDGVTSNLAFLDPSLVHESNQVLLTLTRNDVPIGGGGGGDDGDGGGGVGVGGALDRAMPAPGSDGEDVLFAILGLSVAEVPGALQSLGGVTLGSIGAITWSDAARFADVVADRLSGIGFTAGAPTSLASNNPTEAPQLAFGGGDLADLATGLSQTGPLGLSAGREEDLGLWAAGYGSFGDQEGDRRAPDYDYWVSGVALGLDHALDAGTTVGLAVGFAEGEISHDNGDDQSLEGIQAAFYGGHRVPLGFGELAIDASAGGAYTSYDSERALRFGGLDRKATGDTEAWSYWGNLALRYETTVAEGLALSPEASLRALRTEVDGFSETGAGAANLIVSDFESESLRGRLGGRLRSSHRTSGGWRIIPEARAFVSHEFADDHLTLDLRLEGLGGGFTSRTSDVARTSGVFGLTLTAEDGQDLAIFLDYEGEASQDRSVHSLYGGVKLFW